MKNNKLMGILVGASALTGANTFSKSVNPEPRRVNSMSCSIDSKVRTEIKKGIKNHGNDDTVVLEVPAECRVNGIKNKGWKKGTLYVDVKTAKTIQKNPDVNEIRSTRGSRHIKEEGSYIMYRTDYSLQANYKNKHEDDKDTIFATVEKNIKKDTTKTDKKKEKNVTVSRPKSTGIKVAAKDNRKVVSEVKKTGTVTYGTKDGEVTVKVSENKPVTKVEEKKEANPITKKEIKSIKEKTSNTGDKDIENVINKAISKYI